MPIGTFVLAHGSGLDDAAFTLLPLVFFGAVLVRAKRRAERQAAENGTEPTSGEDQGQ